MEKLDDKATETLEKLLDLRIGTIDRSDGTYMPVHIEIVGRTEFCDFISLAHYGELNGDSMRDPEMIFALHRKSRRFIPCYYRNDYMGVEQYSIRRTDDSILLNRRLQADHTAFANQWLRNIAAQQCIL